MTLCLRCSSNPNEVPMEAAHFLSVKITPGYTMKVFRKELVLDIQLMKFALVIPIEVSGTVSELLQQGNDILPQGL